MMFGSWKAKACIPTVTMAIVAIASPARAQSIEIKITGAPTVATGKITATGTYKVEGGTLVGGQLFLTIYPEKAAGGLASFTPLTVTGGTFTIQSAALPAGKYRVFVGGTLAVTGGGNQAYISEEKTATVP
jgi:hypothetical protein